MLKSLRFDLRRAMIPLILLFLVGYFSFHILNGSRGFLTYIELKTRLEKAEGELQTLTERREQLEQRVALLNPRNPDPDMVDEQVRRNLGFARKNEIIIYR